MLRAMSECHSLLTTRFHGFIIALAFNKLQWVICYDKKILHFLKYIHYSGPWSDLSDLADGKEIAGYLLNGRTPPDYSVYKERAKEQFLYLDRYIEEES